MGMVKWTQTISVLHTACMVTWYDRTAEWEYEHAYMCMQTSAVCHGFKSRLRQLIFSL